MEIDNTLLMKGAAAALIFLVGAAGAYSAIKVQASGQSRLLTIGNCVAGGIFIGAGLIHTLADSAALYSELLPTLDYPVWAATAALSLVALLWIDQGLHRAEPSDGASSFALFIVLSLHSIIAGMALGVEAHPMQALAILIAILAHKGSAAFALGLRTKSQHYWGSMLGFAVMTPLGVAIGASLAAAVEGSSALYFEAVFDSIAAGTFLYVALFEILPGEMKRSDKSTTLITSALAGLLLMAVLAIYT